jgi:phosphorylcholine metabolism protein LicD
LIQETNLKLLAAFDRFCGENGLQYFLIGGAVIGKIRHDGPIPWDDDIDVAMTGDDWRRLAGLLKENPLGADFFISFGNWWNIIKIIHKETGLFIDIFRFAVLPEEIDYAGNYEKFEKRKAAYARIYNKSLVVKNERSIAVSREDSEESMAEKWREIDKIAEKEEKIFDEIIMNNEPPVENGGIVHFSGLSGTNEIFEKETIFPIKRLRFGGRSFPFPNRIDDYAFVVWGDIWRMPDVLAKHGEIVPERAKYFGMKKILGMSDEEFYKKAFGK